MKLTILLARSVCAAICLTILFHGLKIYRVAHDALAAWFMWSGWSEYDAGWAEFKRMLRYKSALRRGAYVEVSERWSTQTCSDCQAVGGPRGLEGLGVRSWVCEACGSVHDRDTNAARNILRSGRSVALQMTETAT